MFRLRFSWKGKGRIEKGVSRHLTSPEVILSSPACRCLDKIFRIFEIRTSLCLLDGQFEFENFRGDIVPDRGGNPVKQYENSREKEVSTRSTAI